MKKVLKILGLVLGAFLVIVAILVALNFTYLKRTFTGYETEQVREIDWYQPQVSMSHSGTVAPFVRSEHLTGQDQNFSDAIAYAEQINSSAFLVYERGELVVEKYWAPYNAESYTQTQSVHKSLLALVVGIALEEGAIDSVDDPVSKYIGEWTDQSMGDITVEQLLNMSSGLGEEEPAKFFLFSHFLRLLNSTDISAVAQLLPQKVPPGSEFEYINTNPQLLVDVLEVATGQQYETYLEEKVWSKIAANSGYLWMDREDGVPHGYCCLMALPEDLLRIGLLVMNQGRANGEQIVPQSWVEKVVSPSELNPNYGYLTWLGSPHTPFRKYSPHAEFGVAHSEPYLADDLIFFDGFGGQRVYIIPSKELVIVRVGETRFDFDDSMLPNRVIEALDSVSAPEVVYADIAIQAEHAEEINLRVSYPAEGEGNHPLILFSHGHYLTNDGYHHLTDQWVEQGYVVVAPLHIDTGDFEYVSALSEELGSDWVAASRILDMTAVIDQIDTISASLDGFSGAIATDNVIAAGHSLGALSAQTIAGATQETQGNSAYSMPEKLHDERVVAVVAISPPGLMPDYLTEKTWEGFSAPQLVVTGTNDVFEYIWQDHSAHFVSYETAEPGDNYLLVMEGVDHYFGNLIGRLEREEQSQTEALNVVAEISLQFMGAYLDAGEQGVSEFALGKDEDINARPSVNRYDRR